MEMNIEKMVIKVVEKALDDTLYKGKTLREWIDLMVKFEKENKLKEDERFLCNSCRRKFECIYYAQAKDFLEKDPNNNMKCERYIKE